MSGAQQAWSYPVDQPPPTATRATEALATEASPSSLPPVGWSLGAALPGEFQPRWDFSYAYFPPLDAVVLFGGAPRVAGQPWYNDTWVYRNGAWSPGPAAPSGLIPRGGAALAYHPGLGKLVLFGGIGDRWPPLADTWLFDGTAWTPGPAAPPGLEGRSGAQMAYLPEIDRLVLFGGSSLTPRNDTWFFDGTEWTPGPPTPPEVLPRLFFGMAHDPVAGKLFVAGGSGGIDTWSFDGTEWTPGPSLLGVGPKERVRIAYDPQLESMLLFSGLGPALPNDDLWRLRNGAWEKIPNADVNPGWPPPRVDGAVLWNPSQDAFMVFGGIASGDVGTTGLKDTWFFRDVAPQVASVTVSPTDPIETQAVSFDTGSVVNGYGPTTRENEWYVNDVKVEGATTPRLEAGPYQNGDRIHARVRLTDQLGLVGPWVRSNVITVVNRPPTIGSVTLAPVNVYVTSTVTATPNRVEDPDKDPVTVHYTWTVNGSDLPGNDQPTLTPDNFTEGDVVGVRAHAVDEPGAVSNTVQAGPKTVRWNLTANNPVKPGKTLSIAGAGFAPGEQVGLKLDAPDATKLATATADANGAFTGAQVTFPIPLPGGVHTMYGVGATSGITGRGPVTVIPSVSISPTALAAGDTTVLSGVGFVPGETVSALFPVGPIWQQTADATGSVVITMTSPELAWPGGTATATAPSGSATASYSVLARFTSPAVGVPLAPAPITLMGYGSAETVNVTFDGSPNTQTFLTDAYGSLRTDLILPSTFGRHLITMAGATSGVARTNAVTLPASMTIVPASGPVGTVVTVQSGPGWVPGSTVDLIWQASTLVTTLTADAGGTVHTTFAIPPRLPGPVTIKLTSPALPGIIATTQFTITAGTSPQATEGPGRSG
jgi:hypothetical protein